MKGRSLWRIFIAVLMGFLLGAGPVVAGTVNFDDVTPPGTNPLLSGGVTFSADSLAVEVAPLFLGTSLAVTPPNILSATASPAIKGGAIGFYPILTMGFDQPEFYVTFHELLYSISIAIRIDQIAPAIVALVAQGLDHTGTKVLDQDRLFFTAGEGFNPFEGDRRITLSADGIKSVTFGLIINSISAFDPSQVHLNVAIDNLAFCACTSTNGPPAPLPGTLLFFGSGLLSLGAWKRYRKN